VWIEAKESLCDATARMLAAISTKLVCWKLAKTPYEDDRYFNKPDFSTALV
jgi:hypothetical protein